MCFLEVFDDPKLWVKVVKISMYLVSIGVVVWLHAVTWQYVQSGQIAIETAMLEQQAIKNDRVATSALGAAAANALLDWAPSRVITKLPALMR